ncbi:uncharacterized protein Z518_01027 [Rhinocladiella mackenziei CBS 650.93]|uniref:Rhinocladiella mackenziei CBS 650.93 unplaced genomic scaffold supercont1.1, whole genome shotgun sequence n=1 Tax=Rhinocladiella mackenziei CBS 650.93 TaxID=1442369 RepID=A0A0D2J2R3_9EURO|nr:uncharacterized protein Z518_01027 [Rhinocladiella mackenziei CBS 650.93]KIX09946.1 hypothetical protein Z518_01027 [Rhinocladiella mackenziei CBS 650.93]
MGSSSKPPLAGVLVHQDHKGKVIGKKIHGNHEIIIGRDQNRCQYVIDDPHISKRHVRIYTVVYENDGPNEVDTLVYAEDLSQNGTYLNGDFIGKGNGGFLLCDGDNLRLSRRTYLLFTAMTNGKTKESFDFVQEREMADFRKDYVVTDRLLGAGTFGRVFMAIDQTSRVQVACKVVDLRKLMPKPPNYFGRPEQPGLADQRKKDEGLEEKVKTYFREFEILASIKHPNIIGLKKVYVFDNTIYMIQDIVTAGDLFSYIESRNGALCEVEAAVIIRQILIALRFLHQNNIVHRDIKPDNILMTGLAPGCRVVLTDFGAARRIQSQRHRMSTVVGTHEYAAPEMLKRARGPLHPEKSGYTRAVDMWALGCVSVILLTGGLAFCDPVTNMYSEILARDCNLEFLRKSKDWQLVRKRPKEFVEKLLVLDEGARMTAEEALEHSWFSNETHKDDFEDLYRRTIKHWHPRTPKSQMIDFRDSGYIKSLACLVGLQDSGRKNYMTGLTAIEPPYKPFPRNMHLTFRPKRDPKEKLSNDVLTAMENWSPRSAQVLSERARYLSLDDGFPISGHRDRAKNKKSRHFRARTVSPPPRRTGMLRPPTKSIEAVDNENGLDETRGPSRTSEGQTVKNLQGQEEKVLDRFPTPGLRPHFTGEHWNHLSSVQSSSTPTSESLSAETSPYFEKNVDEDVLKVQGQVVSNPDPIMHVSMTSSVVTNGIGISIPPGMNVETEGFLSVEAPGNGHKLKRRMTTPSANQGRKKRRGSIFDLAEDDDSDRPVRGPKPEVQKPTNVPKMKHNILNLYLPR